MAELSVSVDYNHHYDVVGATRTTETMIKEFELERIGGVWAYLWRWLGLYS